MRNDLIEFDVIQNGIKGIRARAENGIKRITADFLVTNFFEDIEVLRKRGFSFEEIIDELHTLLAESIPVKTERDKLFAIKSGTLKVYMSRRRKTLVEAESKATITNQSRKNKNVKKESVTIKQTEAAKTDKAEPTPLTSNSRIVPTGRARATDLDREI